MLREARHRRPVPGRQADGRAGARRNPDRPRHGSGGDQRRDAGRQVAANGLQLAALEVGDLDRPSALGGAYHGAEHELEDWLFAECV